MRNIKPRLKPQLREIKVGDDLVFIRPAEDKGGRMFSRKRQIHVLKVVDSCAIVALSKPLVMAHNSMERAPTFVYEGFWWCAVLDVSFLINNCRYK